MTTYLLLHGLENHRPEGHWQRWLAAELRRAGHQVVYPQLPDADSPGLAAWLDLLDAELRIADEGRGDDQLVVLAHSLAASLWLHAAARGVPVRADRVLLVAPAGPDELEEHAPEFAIRPADDEVTPAQVAAAGASTRVVWSGDDPWCAAGADAVFAAPLGLPVSVEPGGRHLALDDGFGPWPAVLAWALDPAGAWPGA